EPRQTMKSVFPLKIAVEALVLMSATPAGAQETWNTLPGEFALPTMKGYYVTAIDGGGRATEPVVVTGATTASSWEKFKIGVTQEVLEHDKAFQTATGNFLTAVDGGGRSSDVLHTDATQRR